MVDSQVISEITQTPKHLSINFLFSGSDQRLMGVYTMLINSLRLETIDSIYYKDLIESMMSRRSADDKVRESVDRSSDAGSLGVSETASPDNTSPLSKNSPGRGARKTMSLTDRMNSMAPKLHRQLPYELMVPSIEDFDLEKMLASNTGAASFNAELLEYGKEHSYDQTESSFHDTVANQLSKQGSARIRTISNDIGRDPAIGKLDRGTSFYQPSYQLQYKMQQLQSEQKRRREGIDREFGHFLHVMTMRKKTGGKLANSFSQLVA